jgi:type IV pilus assembly protein PilN
LWFGHAEVFTVILINLLPHREVARKRKRDFFFVSLGIAALLGGILCGFAYTWLQSQISAQQSKNTFLLTETKKLETQIKDIAGLQAEIAALKARQQAVEDLQSDRNMPVYLLEELTRQLPDGVYIVSMRQDNQIVTINGIAQSNERVSELLRNISNNSQWLTKPDLVEIVAGTSTLGGKDARRVSNFSMRMGLKRNSEASIAAASAAKVSGTTTVTTPALAESLPKKL